MTIIIEGDVEFNADLPIVTSEWQDLTEEELATAIDTIPFDMNNVFYFDDFEKFGRVVEAELRVKNGF